MESEIFKLVLTLNISGVWHPTYEFELLRVELDTVDMLQAQLRDALDELQAIRDARSACVYASLCSQSATAAGQLVTWNGVDPCMVGEVHFARSDDQKSLTIRTRGVYQVHCRLTWESVRETVGGMSLLVNDGEVARAEASVAAGARGTAQLTEVLELAAGAVLAVRSAGPVDALADPLLSRFNIVLLQLL